MSALMHIDCGDRKLMTYAADCQKRPIAGVELILTFTSFVIYCFNNYRCTYEGTQPNATTSINQNKLQLIIYSRSVQARGILTAQDLLERSFSALFWHNKK